MGSEASHPFPCSLSKKVYTVERIKQLSDDAEKRLKSLGFNNIYFRIGDGKEGWKEYSPFDKIIITANVKDEIPKPILKQLNEKGLLISPIGDDYQYLYLYKKENGKIKKYRDIAVAFVPLV